MKGVMVFAGTIEGRKLAEFLAANGIKAHICVATGYGRSLIEDNEGICISNGRLDLEEKIRLMEEYPLVIDATHPYAVNVSEHVKEACARSGAEYIRLVREGGKYGKDSVIVDSIPEAVEYLKGTEGNILVTTGSKDASEYSCLADRAYLRVLPLNDSIDKCTEAGFKGPHIIAMQGPFGYDLNVGLIKQIDAKYLVTKDSGMTGGMSEKMSAAEDSGVISVVIGRPVEEEGLGYSEVVSLLRERYGINDKERRRIDIIGIGMGTPGGLTVDASDAIKEADVIFGAKRMVSSVGSFKGDVVEEYASSKIYEYLSKTQYMKAAVLVSGDVGFYSAARKMLDAPESKDYEIRVFSGISSVVYLCGKLGIAWQDVHLMSAHGRQANVVGEVRRRPKVFSLLEGSEGAKAICSQLIEYGLGNVTVTIGQDLGSEKEKFITGTPEEVMGRTDSKLCVMLIRNPDSDGTCPLGIADEDMIRGDAPMTKSEIRTLSVAKLKLKNDSIVYDIGAGTGSVTIEMALTAVQGSVYAVEKEEEAASLIETNARKFCTPNVNVIRGYAPEAMEDLPAPTHVFIGGSSGNLSQIIACVLKKNPSARIVINSVTIETIAETMDCIKEHGLIEEDVACVNVSKGKKLGRYHLMTAQNPVYIVTCRGPGA